MGGNGSVKQAWELEHLVGRPPAERYVLTLYVTGLTARSTQAIATLQALCEQHLAGRYELSIIDLYQEPELAEARQLIAAPTLIKELPPPLRRLIGDLSDQRRVLAGLDLVQKPHPLTPGNGEADDARDG